MTYQKNDPHTIQDMFGTIAATYDKTNAVLSFGLHKKWNNALVNTVIKDHQPNALLDLCAGTGDITFLMLTQCHQLPNHLYMLDFCPEMLQCAEQKAQKLSLQTQRTLTYIQADAQEIPLPDSSVDTATVAYGIRNVQNPKKCFSEVYRVLSPGGTFGILELTRPSNPLLSLGHSVYLRCFLPLIGACLSSNKDAYQYLCNSIHTFVNPSDLEHMLRDVGFEQVKKEPLSGGIATILFAKKPA